MGRQQYGRKISPGKVLERELKARHLSPWDLAIKMDVPFEQVKALILGKLEITSDLAQRLSQALGTSPQFWINLENKYRKS